MIFAILAGAYLGFRFGVAHSTDTRPAALPPARISSEDLARLQTRVGTFGAALSGQAPAAPLILSADEANALIQLDTNWAALKGHLYVTFESNQLKAQISIPADQLGSKRLAGRYLNAEGLFTIAVRDGQLQVSPQSLSASGRPVPEIDMQQIRARNFALLFTNAAFNALAAKLENVVITNSTLVMVPKQLP